MQSSPHLYVWSIDATTGFDSAWATLEGSRLTANGYACGLDPYPYSVEYHLETADDYVTRLVVVASRWSGGSASLELRRDGGGWTVNGERRQDLEPALDCDLAACPLTNTMPILRHALHRGPAAATLAMAFIEVPELTVVASEQEYSYVGSTPGSAVVHFRSGSFQSDLLVDDEGFVVDYPKLGRRLEPVALPPEPGQPDVGPRS